MAITLYDLAAADERVRFSPYCWRVRLALAHKNLACETIPWRFTEKSAIAFSGQGAVPVLVDGDCVVSDSWAIAAYLDRAYPDRSPLAPGPQAWALTDLMRHWTQTAVHPAIMRIIIMDLFAALAECDREYFRQSREKRFGRPLEEIELPPEEGVAALNRALEPARLALAERPFLCGEEPALADYVLYAPFQWARAVSYAELLPHDGPIRAWRDRMLQLFNGLARDAPRVGAH